MYYELLSITCLPLSASLCYVVPRIVLMTLREKRDFEFELSQIICFCMDIIINDIVLDC